MYKSKYKGAEIDALLDKANNEIPTKTSELINDSDYVTGKYVEDEIKKLMDLVQQMIDDAIANLNKPEPDPEPPVEPEPDEPDTPEEPTVDFGIITNDNSIVIDETQLENGKYTLRYIDSNDNIIDNFNEITTFEINN